MAGAYLLALALISILLSRGPVAAALIVFGGLAAWAFTVRRDKGDLALAAWPVVHALLWLTSTGKYPVEATLNSPLIALPAAWVVTVARLRPKAAPLAVAAAAVLVPLTEAVYAGLAPPSILFRYELLIGLAAAYGLVRRTAKPERTDRLDRDRASSVDTAPAAAGDADAWARALELARRATDAHEAALWRADAEWRNAVLVARAASPGVPAADPVVALEGTPYRWAIEEQLPQLVQPGRRELPVPWAAEMMVVPVALPEGVLALSFPGIVPPGAENAALEAGAHLSTLAALLRIRGEMAAEDARVRAIADAAQKLPGEIEVDAFARQLASSLRRGSGAMGVAVAVGTDEGGGRIQHVDDTGTAPAFAESFGEGESRMALALKAGIDLSWDDLRRDRDRLPLCTPGESWRLPPRSAAVFPLMADGRALGAVAVWHAEPGRFGEKEMELLRLICGLAPLPLRSARRYQALDHRAHTDALTGLPNRASFEEKLASQSNVFDRYARPFGMLVLDVDFFKKFNDTHGHEAGDRVLQHVARLIQASVRDVDLPARLGGEEFVVLLPETGLRATAEVGERVRRAIEARSVMWNGRPLSVTVSVGAAACPDCTPNPSEVLKLGDEALYRAKGGGRNRVSLAPKIGRVPEVEA